MVNRSIFFSSILIVMLCAGCTTTKQAEPQPGTSQAIKPSAVALQASATPLTSFAPSQPNPPAVFTVTPALSRSPAATAAVTVPAVVATAMPAPAITLTQPASTSPTVLPTVASAPTATAQSVVPTATPAPTASNSNCTDQAAFEGDVTVPDNTTFHQGDPFVKTWKLYNSGTCTWGPGYMLVLGYGDPMGATAPNPLPPAAPGASVNVSLSMTAPAGAGQHTGNWMLQNAAGQRFGVGSTGNDYFWVQINVSYANPQVTPSGGAGPTPGGPQPTPTATTTTTSEGCAYTRNPGFEDQILQQINTVRASKQLNALTLNPLLSASALTYSLDMACNNRVDFYHHTDSKGGRWYDRISAQGYAYSAAFENVFVGNPAYSGGTPQAAMIFWMGDTIHKDNILNPDITEIGIAYVFTANSLYGGYYTTDFAVPK